MVRVPFVVGDGAEYKWKFEVDLPMKTCADAQDERQIGYTDLLADLIPLSMRGFASISPFSQFEMSGSSTTKAATMAL